MRDDLDRGYVPPTWPRARSAVAPGQTLEYAFQDWTLAQFARQLDKRGINIAQFAKASASSGTGGAGDRRPAGALG